MPAALNPIQEKFQKTDAPGCRTTGAAVVLTRSQAGRLECRADRPEAGAENLALVGVCHLGSDGHRCRLRIADVAAVRNPPRRVGMSRP